MRDYIKPLIEDEKIELEDIIAGSPAQPMKSPTDLYDPNEDPDSIGLDD